MTNGIINGLWHSVGQTLGGAYHLLTFPLTTLDLPLGARERDQHAVVHAIGVVVLADQISGLEKWWWHMGTSS